MSEETKQDILNVISDMIADFLYYDRKEDEDLPRGAIEKAIEDDVITVNDIVQHFREKLEGALK